MPFPTDVSYHLSQDAWPDFSQLVEDIARKNTTRTVCDVGGGANPALESAFVKEEGLAYTVLDVSASELAKAPPSYRKVVADIAGPLPDDLGKFDLVFSKTLAEHVGDAERFHRNVLALLTDDGVAVHLFPTLFAPAFIANLILPARVSRWLVMKVQGTDRDIDGIEGKFPAFYRWCRGPSRRQIERFSRLGYDVTEYRGYFGTPGYYKALRLAWLDGAISRLLKRYPVPALTGYGIVLMRRSGRGHSVTR